MLMLLHQGWLDRNLTSIIVITVRALHAVPLQLGLRQTFNKISHLISHKFKIRIKR